MYYAGCRKLNFGVETGSITILKSIHKRISLEQVLEIAEFGSALRIHTSFNFMIPHPEDSVETLCETLDFAQRLAQFPTVTVTFNATTVFPGTGYFENRDELGIRIIEEEPSNSFFINPNLETRFLTKNDISRFLARGLLLEAKSLEKIQSVLGGEQFGD